MPPNGGQVTFASQTQPAPPTASAPNPSQVYFGTTGPTDWTKLKLHPVRLPDLNAPIAQAPAAATSYPELASPKMEQPLEPARERGSQRRAHGEQLQPAGARGLDSDRVTLPSSPRVPSIPPLSSDGTDDLPPIRPKMAP